MKKENILLQIMSLHMGIVPIDQAINKDVNKILSGLAKDEVRKSKRKFRKLWRKIKKNNGALQSMSKLDENGRPKKSSCHVRKGMVMYEMSQQVKKWM